jgi:HTH-type transcriptional regulator, competence development regulator
MDNAFGAALRIYRRSAGLTQRELAQKSRLDFSYISKIENGRLPPPAADTVVSMCHILKIPPERLLALTGKIPSDVQESISGSSAAQEFLREAQVLGLTDEDWVRLRQSLRIKKGRRP